MAQYLVDLGVSYVEGGWPGSNPKDSQFFHRWQHELSAPAAVNGTKLVAFGSTRRRHSQAGSDPQLKALLDCGAGTVTLVAKAWDAQVDRVLRCSLPENLDMIADSVALLKQAGREVVVDAEHFLDGYSANAQYALDCLRAAAGAGADWLVLCDTNGGSMPWAVQEVCERVSETLGLGAPGTPGLGIHCHNDAGCAVANSLAAVRGGCTMVQGCVNGYGERTGNADIIAVAAGLELKLKRTCLPPGKLEHLTRVSRGVAAACRQRPAPGQPYAGTAAFAHKGGLHVAALQHMPESYNHCMPALVGNAATTVVSDMSGKANIREAARLAGFAALPEATLDSVLAQVKALEAAGAAFEAAPASVELLLRRALAATSTGEKQRLLEYESPFHVREFNVLCSNRSFAAAGDAQSAANGNTAAVVSNNTAVVKLELPGGRTVIQAGEGNGPVNALAHALLDALVTMYPALTAVRLADYKVDLLGMGGTTAAVTRVSCTFERRDSGTAGAREPVSWQTVGAHSSIVEASFRALVDGLEWGIEHCDDDGCHVPVQVDKPISEGVETL